MRDYDDIQFDLKIRSIAESGEEEVPARIWEGIESRLDAAGKTGPAGKARTEKRLHVMPWLSVAGLAAALTAAAVVFSWTRDVTPGDSTGTLAYGSTDIDIIQSVPAGILAEASMPGPEAMPYTVAEMPLSRNTAMDACQATPSHTGLGHETETGQDHETDHPHNAVQPISADTRHTDGQSSRHNSGSPAGEPDASAWTDNGFPEDEVKDAHRTEVALNIFGNALSNKNDGDGGPSGPMRSPGINPVNQLHEENSVSFGIPLSFGVGVKISFTPKWALSAGVNYSLLTRTLSGTYYDGNGVAYSDPDIRNSQHYIGIPVNVYYNIFKGDFADVYAYAGGTVEKCVSDRYLIDAGGTAVNYHGKSRGVQLSADIGIGVEFTVADRLGLYIDPSLRYYFKSAQPKSLRTVQPLMLGFEAGLRVRL